MSQGSSTLRQAILLSSQQAARFDPRQLADTLASISEEIDAKQKELLASLKKFPDWAEGNQLQAELKQHDVTLGQVQTGLSQALIPDNAPQMAQDLGVIREWQANTESLIEARQETDKLVPVFEAADKKQQQIFESLSRIKGSNGTTLDRERIVHNTTLSDLEPVLAGNLAPANWRTISRQLQTIRTWQTLAENAIEQAPQKQEDLARQTDDVLKQTQHVLSLIANPIREQNKDLLQFTNVMAPPITVADCLSEDDQFKSVAAWIKKRRDWADLVAAVLNEENLIGDVVSALQSKTKGLSPAAQKVATAICTAGGQLGAVIAAYNELLKLPGGQWVKRQKEEEGAEPVAQALGVRGVDVGTANQLALAALRQKLDLLRIVQDNNLTPPTLAALVASFGPKQATTYIGILKDEGKLSRFVNNRDVTPQNFTILLQNGDVTLVLPNNPTFAYKNCSRHKGQAEIEAAIDVVWTNIEIKGIWAVAHMHYCSGQYNPAQQTTDPNFAGFFHLKSGNFGGSGGPITHNATRLQLTNFIGNRAL